MEEFKILYDFVKAHEDAFDEPWMRYNAFFNTTPEGEIDLEAPHGIVVTKDINEIKELLLKNSLKLDLNHGVPAVTRIGENQEVATNEYENV